MPEQKRNCPDCGVAPGHIHLPGCDVERCPKCGGQLISCDCRVNEIEQYTLLPWTGTWPGEEECIAFGWYSRLAPGHGWVQCEKDHPDAGPDLNRLHMECSWDAEARTWRKGETDTV